MTQASGAEKLSLLGQSHSDYPSKPEDAVLETIPNHWTENDYLIELDCPEFTCLCPKTSQPDFAEIKIEYYPAEKLIESKALKLYLHAFRNEGIFHEFVINRIAHDLQKELQAKAIKVTGNFKPRGGISIKPQVILGEKNLFA